MEKLLQWMEYIEDVRQEKKVRHIHVREAKGRIDRYTILSRKNLDLLTEYWFQCGRPEEILFLGSWTGDYLDIASVNQFFKASAKKAGITRRV